MAFDTWVDLVWVNAIDAFDATSNVLIPREDSLGNCMASKLAVRTEEVVKFRVDRSIIDAH
jgi:hypothetical protein